MLLLLVSFALGYDEKVHHRVTTESLTVGGNAERFGRAAQALDPAAAARLRATLDAAARADAAVGPEWTRRYPTPDAFDAWALKELLLFSPDATVYGIDRFDVEGDTHAARLALGAREPDDDLRNRERLAHEADRKPIAGVPADPALLNMGKLGALSSQAHAHYGLPQLTFSDDSDVLKTDPPRFAVAAGYPPGPILTLAAEMAQEHLDLALLAELGGDHDLAMLHAGQGFHYIEDVANPVHCVQVGLIDIFVDAFKARMLLSAQTAGGYLGNLRTLASIGIDMLSTYHTLSEDLTRNHLLRGDDKLVGAMHTDDPDLVAAIGALDPRGEFALALTRALIDRSSKDGSAMYAATRTIADPRFRRIGQTYDYTRDDPDAMVVPLSEATRADWDAFWALQARSFGRAGTALRVWANTWEAAVAGADTPEARAELSRTVAVRLAARQLKMLGEADARLADYRAHPPASTSAPDRMPGMLVGELVLAGALLGAVVWWRRRA